MSAVATKKDDFLSNFSSHLKIISETGGVGNNLGVPWEERLTQFMLGNVIYASFPTMAMKKTKSFTGMIKTYVVYRVAEDLQKWNYGGCQNPFSGIPGVPGVPPLQTDSVKRFLTPSLPYVGSSGNKVTDLINKGPFYLQDLIKSYS